MPVDLDRQREEDLRYRLVFGRRIELLQLERLQLFSVWLRLRFRPAIGSACQPSKWGSQCTT